MTSVRIGFAALLLAVLLAFVPGARADYEVGEAAWDEGRHTEAREEWLAAAEAGDSRAMLALGRLYIAGVGVPQDYVEAHKWLNLAAGFGEPEAAAERDTLAQEMTVEERAEARKLARAWRSSTENAAAPDAPSVGESVQPQESASVTPLPASTLHEAQVLLAALGYAPGPADGIWGKRSKAAYRAFVRDAGLLAGDEPTAEAMEVLRSIAEQFDVDAPITSPSAKDIPASTAVPADAALRAARAGDIEGLTAALAGGADPNARDSRGWTALMLAANEGYALLIPALLEAGAEIDARAADGATALFIAALHGDATVVVALMRAGADIAIRGPRGKTASDAARTNWGEADAARKEGADPAVVALLEGVNWAEAERRERIRLEWPVGKEFRDCAECPEMVVVPAGTFEMGSPASEAERDDSEGPVHRVTIPRPFAVGKYEVTRGEFSHFVAETGDRYDEEGCHLPSSEWSNNTASWRFPGFRQSDRDPVVCVSWETAWAYAMWLSGKTGHLYRLLSESEWEYVARAGTLTPFYTGQTISTDQANYFGTHPDETIYGSNRQLPGMNRERTVPVGSFYANSWGLYDVHGNVAEFVEDCTDGWEEEGYERDAPSDGRPWYGADCNYRVLRGGSWYDSPRDLRSAARGWDVNTFENNRHGFRVARKLEAPLTTPDRNDTDVTETALPARETPVSSIAGNEFRDCRSCPEMVVVPAGSFMMGSPALEGGRQDNEGPAHRVTILQPFAVGKYEVTRGEFGQFVVETDYSIKGTCRYFGDPLWPDESPGFGWRNPGFDQEDRDPVVCVSWKDTQAYVRWMSEKTGEEYRLLSESEWEYAARAGTQTRFHTGWTISADQANFEETGGVNRDQTVPAGSFAANGFGLHDMHGNAKELVEDCYNRTYHGAPSDGSSWESDGSSWEKICDVRVVRGGSWWEERSSLRSANRDTLGPSDRTSYAGFRIARTLTP